MTELQAAEVPSTAERSEDLARAITAPLLFFYMPGDVLGSGIYALVGTMAGQVGARSGCRSPSGSGRRC